MRFPEKNAGSKKFEKNLLQSEILHKYRPIAFHLNTLIAEYHQLKSLWDAPSIVGSMEGGHPADSIFPDIYPKQVEIGHVVVFSGKQKTSGKFGLMHP